MLIFTHVLVAFLGLAQATYGLVSPSKAKIRITYVFTAATIGSGTYLVWHLHAPILQSCLSGLTYLGLIIAATAATQRRLARATQQ